MFRLIIEKGAEPGRRYAVKNNASVTLGSGEQDDLHIEDSDIGPGHVQLTAEGKFLRLRVGDGATEVEVNGVHTNEAALVHGDRFVLGSTQAKVFYAELVGGHSKRRTSRMQHLTVVGIAAVLVLEVLFIVTFSWLKDSETGMEPTNSTVPSEDATDQVPDEPAKPPRRPPLFIRDVGIRTTEDNQGMFRILLLEPDLGVRRVPKGEAALAMEVERRRGTQAWERVEQWVPPPSVMLEFSDERLRPSAWTVLIPQEQTGNALPPEQEEAPAKMLYRARVALALEGQLIEEKTIFLE